MLKYSCWSWNWSNDIFESVPFDTSLKGSWTLFFHYAWKVLWEPLQKTSVLLMLMPRNNWEQYKREVTRMNFVPCLGLSLFLLQCWNQETYSWYLYHINAALILMSGEEGWNSMGIPHCRRHCPQKDMVAEAIPCIGKYSWSDLASHTLHGQVVSVLSLKILPESCYQL